MLSFRGSPVENPPAEVVDIGAVATLLRHSSAPSGAMVDRDAYDSDALTSAGIDFSQNEFTVMEHFRGSW